jgi:hypothetical protein
LLRLKLVAIANFLSEFGQLGSRVNVEPVEGNAPANVDRHGSPSPELSVGRALSANGRQVDNDTSNGGDSDGIRCSNLLESIHISPRGGFAKAPQQSSQAEGAT